MKTDQKVRLNNFHQKIMIKFKIELNRLALKTINNNRIVKIKVLYLKMLL